MSNRVKLTESEFVPAVVDPGNPDATANWLMFLSGKPVLVGGDVKNPVPYFDKPSRMGITVLSKFYLGQFRGEPCYAAALDPLADLPGEFVVKEMKLMLAQLPESWFQLLGLAHQIITWDKNHQYCGACGTPTHYHPVERVKACPECGLENYPRLSPCIITLVTHGDKVLLGRSVKFVPNLYSTLAGYVEPGETVEQAVHREVMEEVGVQLESIEYVKSQPWPFPHSLMLGFIAKYGQGDISVDKRELEDASWWHIDKLPLIPPTGTISRSLIDIYIKRYRAGNG